MYLAYGARPLAAVTLAAVTMAAATLGAAAATPGTAVGHGTAAASAAAPAVTITPGVQHHQREPRTGLSTTVDCEHAIQIACYNPAQIQQAYNLFFLNATAIT